MQNQNLKFNKFSELKLPIARSLSDEKVKELEWFLKLEAVKAVNIKNKDEFEAILRENDMDKFVQFIIQYIPDFHRNLSNFLEEK